MKKIYLLAVAFVMLNVARAQNCVGIPHAKNTVWNGFCVVIASGMSANAQVRLYDANLNPIPITATMSNAQGEVEAQFDCNYTPARIVTCVDFDNGGGCCGADIPPQIITPVKLTSFSGRLQTDNSVNLDWTSAIEFESSSYEVERSPDGRSYEKVGTLNAAGTSLDVVSYKFTDHLPASGGYWYRLKQIDLDGKFEYSKVVYVNSKKGTGVITKVFPNPFTSEIQLIGATSADMTPNNIKVYTISGQPVKFNIVGANAIAIDVNAPKGMYIVHVKGEQFKIVKY